MEPLEDEVSCIMADTMTETDNQCTMAAVCLDGKEEPVVLECPAENPSGIGLPAVLEVNDKMPEVALIEIEEFL